MNFARIWCFPNPTPARRVTPPWNVYMAKFDPGWEGYPVWQTWLPALVGHPTYHVHVIKLKACLHEGGGPQVGEVTCGGSPHLACKRDQIKMRHYMDRRVTPPKRITSPTRGPTPPCKQALKWEITWTGELPHLPGVPHLHVNRYQLRKTVW